MKRIDGRCDQSAFDAFVATEPAKQELRALLDSAKQTDRLQAAEARTLDPRFNGNNRHWQQIYESLTD